jgi:hypothetical protein
VTGGGAVEPIRANGLVPARREAVFAFIARLEHHWRVADRWIEVLELDADGLGGRVRMRGPLGVSRTVTTRVDESDAPARLHGTALLGATRAEVTWTLSDAGFDATRVQLEARVLEAGALDRMLLAAGGRAWLRRRLASTVAALAAALSPSSAPEARA